MKQIVRAAVAHELGEQVGRLAERAAPRLQRLVDHRRVPHRDLAPRARRAVAVDERDVVAGRSAARRARPGWRSSRWPAGSAARSRRRRRSAAAGAARWRRASRTRRGRRAPRRPRRPRGWRRSRPTRGGWAGSRRAACRGWSARGSSAWRIAAALLARRVAVVDRRAHLPAAGRTRSARAPGPGPAPWSGRGTARARAGRGTGRRASAG